MRRCIWKRLSRTREASTLLSSTGINFSGFVAWFLWRTIYLSKLPRFEKKVRVALDWTLDLCFAKDFASVTAGYGAGRAIAVAAEPSQAGAA